MSMVGATKSYSRIDFRKLCLCGILALYFGSSCWAADGILIRFPLERITRTSTVDQSTESANKNLACVRMLTAPIALQERVETTANELALLFNAGDFTGYGQVLVQHLDWVESMRAQDLAVIPIYIPLFLDQLSKNRLFTGSGLSETHISRIHMLMLEFVQEHPTLEDSEQILLQGMPDFLAEPLLDGIGNQPQWRENWLNGWLRYNQELANSRNADAVFDEARDLVTSQNFKSVFHKVGKMLKSPNVSMHQKSKIKKWIKDVGVLVDTLK